jgi:hypothetical protein
MEAYSESWKKPVILIDNVHCLKSMPNSNMLLKDIEYLRWVRACNFLMTS